MLLKNGKAAEKTKTRRAATTHRSRISTRSLQPKNIFDSPEAIKLGSKIRTSVRKQKAAATWAAALKYFAGHTPATILGRLVFHRATVRLLHERAFRIKPFEHDIFALVLRKRVGAALGVRERKIRRSAAHRRRVEAKDCGGDQ